jgi:hypothetical protein
MRTIYATIALFLAVAGCDPYPGDSYFYAAYDAQKLRPTPERMRTLYLEVEACSGMDGNFREVTWWVADDLDGAVGRFYRPASILIKLSVLGDRAEDWAIGHESLHHILYRNGYGMDPDHGHSLWGECAAR